MSILEQDVLKFIFYLIGKGAGLWEPKVAYPGP